MKRKTGTLYTSHDEDKILVNEAISGNQKAYNKLLKKYKPILYTAAYRRLPYYSPEELEDIAMIVLGTTFVKLSSYDPAKSKVFSWMIACLHNYVNAIPNQKKRIQTKSIGDMFVSSDEKPSSEYEIPSPDRFDESFDREQSMKLFKLLLEKLPKDIADVMKLKFWKDYTHEQISVELNIKKSSIVYKLKRGREILKKLSERNNFFK